MTDDAAPHTYDEQLKADLGNLIAQIDLPALSREMMRTRWLDQLTWLEGKAHQTQRRYYGLRLTAIVGGVLLPALVSLNVDDGGADVVRWLTFGLSLVVAVCIAVEEFFHYGDRWRHYRQQAELMKMEGWRFFQLAEPYAAHGSHAAAYPTFAARVEDLLRQDVDVFVTEVVRERKDDENGAAPAPAAHAFAAPSPVEDDGPLPTV